MDHLDDLNRRRAEGVGDEGHLLVLEGDLHLRGGGGFSPPEELQRVVLTWVGEGHAVVEEELAGELQVAGWDHLAEHFGEFIARHVGVHTLVLIRDHDVDAVGVVTNVLVDPVELDLELLRAEAHGAEDAEAAGLGHRHHHVAAVGEGEDGEFNTEFVANWRVHTAISTKEPPSWHILCRGGRKMGVQGLTRCDGRGWRGQRGVPLR